MTTERIVDIETQLTVSRDELLRELGRTYTKGAIAPDVLRKGREIYE